MLEEETLLKEVSIRISKELERKGYGKHKLEVTSWLVKIRESIESADSKTQALFLTGSNAEGTDVTGSDRDTMIVFPYCFIVADKDKSREENEGNIFLMVQDETRPCYPKLQLVQESRDKNITDLFHILGGKDKLCIMDENQNFLLSSEKFTAQITEHVFGLNQSSSDHIVSSFRVHGPCATFDNEVRKTKFDTDFAYCIPCSVIPKEVQKFIHRHRQYDWPPKDLIQNSLSRGFHVVAVGDKMSTTQSVEWRMSFAALERELVWSLNDTQCKCYIMLKILQKMFLEGLAPEELSSYALKTVMFWCAETEDPSFWREDNLLRCIYHCLSHLCSYVTLKCLPHFVVPGNNLLASKFNDEEKHAKVSKQLKEMSEWHWSSFLQCPQLSTLKIQFDELGQDVNRFLRCSRHPNISQPFYKDILSFRACQSLYMDINSYVATTGDIEKTLALLKCTKIDGIGKEILKFGINAVQFRAAKIKCKKSSVTSNEGTPEQIRLHDQQEEILYERVSNPEQKTNILSNMHEPEIHFHTNDALNAPLYCTAGSPDVCTGNLQSALENLLRSEFERAGEILQNVLHSYQPHIVYLGMCGPEEADMIEYACFTASSGELSLVDKIRKIIAFDFVICKEDCVTPFLQNEQIFWNDNDVPICIHPRIMTYYLSFLSAFALCQETMSLSNIFALSMNVDAMCRNQHLYSHIAWNILGHCYFLKKNYNRAMRCFSNSLLCKKLNNPALHYIGHC